MTSGLLTLLPPCSCPHTHICFVSAFKRALPSGSSPREGSPAAGKMPGLWLQGRSRPVLALQEDRLQTGALSFRGWDGPAVPPSPTWHSCPQRERWQDSAVCPLEAIKLSLDPVSLVTHAHRGLSHGPGLSPPGRALSSGLAGDTSVLTEDKGSLGQASGDGGLALWSWPQQIPYQ